MLARTELCRAAAKLPREQSREVVTVGESVLCGDLINRLVCQSQRLARQTQSRACDIGGWCRACVFAESTDEALDSHACALC